MSAILPFQAVRYATAGDSDLSTRIAPPYDVLDQADKDALLSRDMRNFVRIDLPHVPPKSAGPDSAYATAREDMDRWLADGTLVRDERPALYVYHQKYTHAGTSYSRKMFFARLKLQPLGEGGVFPHEQTFGGPKEDRLCLTRATQANLSPIFLLYEDAENDVARRCENAIGGAPPAHGALDGVENQLWAVDDAAAIRDVKRMMSEKPVYIADEHHRYGTALLYRDELAAKGELTDEHPANYVLCVLCAMEDPGLLILPTHRVLPGVSVDDALLRSDEKLRVETLDVSDPERIIDALAEYGPQALALHTAQGTLAVRPRSADVLEELQPDHSDAWRGLALAFLHAYLIERRIAPELCGGSLPKIQYIKAAAPAMQAALDSGGTAFLMQPTTMEELRSVCQAGDLMPQKSTYFFPKLASGLVVNRLTVGP